MVRSREAERETERFVGKGSYKALCCQERTAQQVIVVVVKVVVVVAKIVVVVIVVSVCQIATHAYSTETLN